MKFINFFLVAVIGSTLMACNAEDQPEVKQHETDSYASITVKFPGKASTRALPGDYNQNGVWTGRDTLETVTVFLVNIPKGVVDYNSFTKSAFQSIDADGVLHPNLALKATAGDSVRAFVVINGEASILNALKATSAANFQAEFADAVQKTASQVARLNPNGRETIMMTNDADSYVIKVVSGVNEEDAMEGPGNHVEIQVERVVSRAFMTVTPEANTNGGWPVNAVIGGVETQIATVTNVTYAVGQSNNNFFLMKQANYAVPSPVYAFNPENVAAWNAVNTTNFDYSGLTSFTAVTPWTYNIATIATPLAAETTSKFVLPVNHLVDETDIDVARDHYKKGNTTYFEIRATFIPSNIDGETNTTVPDSVFWGENDKKFYSTRALAEAQGQKATEFTGGVMKYVLWLNPNDMTSTGTDPNPKVSPTVRNQVYHAHINAFLRMGVPNNPLNPEDPDNGDNPDNLINVEDPLKTDFTYLSVSVKVLPWTIHTYQYSLTDPGTMY